MTILGVIEANILALTIDLNFIDIAIEIDIEYFFSKKFKKYVS